MIPQFSQLFIHHPDKSNSVCKIFISAPSLDKEQTLGRLFGIIEIESADRGLWNTINTLAEEMEKDYYGEDNIQLTTGTPNREISVEETFEKSIQFFNDKLIELIKGGRLANLLDKISIIIGILKDDKVHFATVGHTSSFLIHQLKSQEYRIIDVLETSGSKEEKINPFKILTNIVSGEINKNDSILFCTNSLLDYLSLDKIKQTLTTQEPAAATRHLKDLLIEASINTTFASIIIKMVSGTEEVKIDKEIELPQKSLDHLVVTEKATEEFLSPPFKSNLKKYSRIIVKKTKNLVTAISQRSWNFIKEKTNQKLEARKAATKAKVKKEKVQKSVPEMKIEKIEEIRNDDILDIEKEKSLISPTADLLARLKEFSAPLKSLTKKISFIPNKITGLFAQIKNIFKGNRAERKEQINKIYNYFINKLAKYLKKFRSLPKASQGLFIAALILFVIFSYSIVSMAKNRVSADEQKVFNRLVIQVEDKKNEIESALIYNDEKRASELMTEAQELYNQMNIKTKGQENQITTLEKSLSELNLKLQHIIEVEPEVLANFSTVNSNINPATLTLVEDNLYTIDSADNSFYSVSLANGNINDLGLKANNPQIKLAINDGKDIIYYHSGNSFIKYNTGNNKLENLEATLTNQENKIKGLGIYNRRLYILTPANNQVYRYNRSGNTLSSPTNWVRDDSNLENIIDLAIDGDMYLLANNGEIKKYTAGKQKNFSTGAIDPALDNPTKISTSTNSDSLYVLDKTNQRLIELDKSSGRLIAQYRSNSFNDLKDLIIDYKNKQAFLLNGKSVLKINLQ